MANSVHFERPPLVEVAFGILFSPIAKLLPPHLGVLWGKWRSEFPQFGEAPPLPPVVEFEEGSASPANISLNFSTTPPMARIWYVSNDGQNVIQVQKDRFVYNWRKNQKETAYPHYATAWKEFQRRTEEFTTFLQENSLGEIHPVQYELTYVDHIAPSERLRDLGLAMLLARVFPDFSWRNAPHRSLPEPVGFEHHLVFPLPDARGKLHVTIRSAVRAPDHQPLLIVESLARGIDSAGRPAIMNSWFDVAHNQIVAAFMNLTDEDIQRTDWGKKE